jgi:hypothetical protein
MYIMIIIVNQTSKRQPFFHFEPQRSWGIPPALSYGGAIMQFGNPTGQYQTPIDL